MIAQSSMRQILSLAFLPGSSLSAYARSLATLSLFDWLVVARAGRSEPVARIIREFVASEGGNQECSVVGEAIKVPARAAALANGTISHALDYDDTHFAHVGHLSVAVMPAALALGEATGASVEGVRDAFLVGAEVACRIGVVLGRQHYERGFHQTATAGAFGATVAAGRLLGLPEDQMREALSIVSTRASGLKSQFGTMGKPLNAGIAASNGVEAVLLAKRGFVSCDDGIGGVQGFVDTHTEIACDAEAWSEPPPARFLFEENKYKLHACCHGTHAMLNALIDGRRKHNLKVTNVRELVLNTNPRWLRVCDIKKPRTGLEAKFSYGLLAAMALSGIDTAADRSYSDELCANSTLTDFSNRVFVRGDESLSDTAARMVVNLNSGNQIELSHDLAQRVPLDTLENGLRAKASALLGADMAERLWQAISSIGACSAVDISQLLRP